MEIVCKNCGYKNTSYDSVCFQCKKSLDEEKQKAGKTKYVQKLLCWKELLLRQVI
jgi:hypothetical protein